MISDYGSNKIMVLLRIKLMRVWYCLETVR